MQHNLSEISAGLEFQFVGPSQQSPSLIQEIVSFLDTQDTSHPFQLPQWSSGVEYLAVFRRRGRIQWFAQCGIFYPVGRILPFFRALMVHRGPVCDDQELMEAGLHRLIDESRKRGLVYIDIAPEWVAPFAVPVLARSSWQALEGGRLSLRLDLRPAPESLLAGFRATTRYKIRRSEAAGVEVKIAYEEADLQDFLRLYVEMAMQKQFAANDPDFLRGVFGWLAADRSRGGMFVALEDGVVKGGILVVRCAARCWYILGATAKDSKFTAGHLLQWKAIQWAKANGCLEYDFGGYQEGASSGPAYFKRGFCDNVVRFVAPHRYVVNQSRQRLADLASSLRSRLQQPRSCEPLRRGV
jgi:peptidoglycan pentaglycine glycine transferase (the first glycine)